MTQQQKQLVVSLIDFAWKQRAFDNPEAASAVEALRQEMLQDANAPKRT
jgi:hypothetical protein